jgi:hypothetical protein
VNGLFLKTALTPGRMSRAIAHLTRHKLGEVDLLLADHLRIGSVTTRELRGRLAHPERRQVGQPSATRRTAHDLAAETVTPGLGETLSCASIAPHVYSPFTRVSVPKEPGVSQTQQYPCMTKVCFKRGAGGWLRPALCFKSECLRPARRLIMRVCV